MTAPVLLTEDDFWNQREGLNLILYSALLQIREIDTWAALKDRTGSTLIPELRKLYSGEELGFGYADPDKRVLIPDHSYRACIIAGVQPGRGQALLADADGGTPQRFCWL